MPIAHGGRSGSAGLALLLSLAACRGGADGDVARTPEGPLRPAPPVEVLDRAPRAAPNEGALVRSDAGSDAGSPSPTADGGDVAEGAPPEGMLLVPGGTFTMGADRGGEQDEHPAHAVTLRAFYLDRTEVTQAAYSMCVAANACSPARPDLIGAMNGAFRGDEKPVVGISWHDARAYCAFVGKRLPREAEHERAVRGDDGRRFPWGNEEPSREHTVFAASHPEPVGVHPKGRGPYGHDDLAGNVWEWMEDVYDPYAYRRPRASEGVGEGCEGAVAAQDELRRTGKQGFTGSNPIPSECERSIRGGAYNYPAAGLRSTNRVHHPPSYKLKMTGVRCARDAGPPPAP